MEILWKFKFHPKGHVSLIPIVVNGKLFVLSDYYIWSLNSRWGFYYYKEPVIKDLLRPLMPKRDRVYRFIHERGLLYILMKDRFGKTYRIIFDPDKMSIVHGDLAPLKRSVKYIFKADVKIQRSNIDTYREGISAVSGPDDMLLWTSSDSLRPAIKYTEIVGELIQIGDEVIIAQNYFSRRGKMPAGYSIISFDYETGKILWSIESYTYSSKIYPFVVVGDFMYITTGSTGGYKEGFFKKVDLNSGKLLINEPFFEVESGVAWGDGVFFFGAGGEVIALKEGD